ncbi:MAG: hypothetical protein ACREVE_09280 [Gammaproteobacteria bacterium]
MHGFVAVRRRGSHIVMQRTQSGGSTITVFRITSNSREARAYQSFGNPE